MVSHCDFDLHFLNDWWGWASFHVLFLFFSHLYIFVGERRNVYSSSLFVFKLGCLLGLLIAEFQEFSIYFYTKSLSDMGLKTYFHSVSCLFSFLIMSCDAQKFKIFVKPRLSISCSRFGVKSPNPLPNSNSWVFTPVFSSQSFIILTLGLGHWSVLSSFLCVKLESCIWNINIKLACNNQIS